MFFVPFYDLSLIRCFFNRYVLGFFEMSVSKEVRSLRTYPIFTGILPIPKFQDKALLNYAA